MAWYKHTKGSGVVLGWRVGGDVGGARMSPHQTSPLYEEFTASCGQSRTPAHSSLKEGERERIINTEGEMDGRFGWQFTVCRSAPLHRGRNAVVTSLYHFWAQMWQDKELRFKTRRDQVGFSSVVQMNFVLSRRVAIWFTMHETMFICSRQLVFWADWHLVKMESLKKNKKNNVLISTSPSWCRVARVEGRQSHFLSGPCLKKGQIQPDINHSVLHSSFTSIVTGQTSGRRPAAGGNQKSFDSCRQRFHTRLPLH